MKCYLLEGIWKAAFVVPTGGRSQLRPWGGTTADVGSEYQGAGVVGMAPYFIKGLKRTAGPIAGITELGYGLTKGVSDARKKGAKFGRELGKSNMFLAGRL